jgi:hypothetical protein
VPFLQLVVENFRNAQQWHQKILRFSFIAGVGACILAKIPDYVADVLAQHPYMVFFETAGVRPPYTSAHLTLRTKLTRDHRPDSSMKKSKPAGKSGGTVDRERLTGRMLDLDLEQARDDFSWPEIDAGRAALSAALARGLPPLRIIQMPTVGNCFFEALAHQLLQHPDHPDSGVTHDILRERIVNHVAGNRDELEPFFEGSTDVVRLEVNGQPETFSAYIQRMLRRGQYAGQFEVYVASYILNAEIHIFGPGAGQVLITQHRDKPGWNPDGRCFRIVHYGNNHQHYDSVEPVHGEAPPGDHIVAARLQHALERGL